MFENIAAIDIGTSSVKVVLVKTGLKDFQVKSFVHENLSDTAENRLDALNDALGKIVSEEGLSEYRVITNLPMEKTIIRNVTFPFSDVQKIAEAIPYEAEDNIPFNIEDLMIDFQPLKSENKDEGRVLLAAATKENIHDFIRILNGNGLNPVRMGMESSSLYECYRYFNKEESESAIQIHMGDRKTIINLIKNNSLIFTRSISIGMNNLYTAVSEILKVSRPQAADILRGLNLDYTSLSDTLKSGQYKSMGITRDKMKNIHAACTGIISELIEQILLTVKSYSVTGGELNINRVLMSGGGSTMSGIGHSLSRSLELPLAPLPFLEDAREEGIQALFPVAFGMILSYMNKKSPSINFLKGEFIPDIVRSTKKIYYLAAFFALLTLTIFILNIVISTFLISRSNKKYHEILADKYRKYFNDKKIPDDPITEANKIIRREKTELDNLTALATESYSTLDLLMDLTSNFSPEENFELKDMVINERVIRIDGSIGSSKAIDDFKEKLTKSNKFESVALNIRFSKKNEVRFTMTIKQKTEPVKEVKEKGA